MREPLQQVMKTEPVRMSACHHSSSHDSDDAGVEYLETMKKLAVATMLPKSELTVFDGNPLKNQKEGYLRAKRMSSERFGDVFKVFELADDLESCAITLKATGRLAQINNEDRLVKILERCPGFVKSRWQSHVQDIRAKGREPNIEDVRRLIKTVALEKNDPVFGRLMDGGGKDSAATAKSGRRLLHSTVRPTFQRNMNFSVQTHGEKIKEIGEHVKCYYCDKNHKVDSCEEFKKLNGEEQFKFIRARKLCNNCLSSFHFAAGCKRKHECREPGCQMKWKHMTSIHGQVLAFEQRHNEQWRQTVGGDQRDKAHFNESLADDGKMMSVQDKHALEIFEESAQLVNGHYQIAIPWKQGQPCMPNNRRIAEQRLGHLKRRLVRDPALKQRLCREKIGWDAEIADIDLVQWNKWLQEVPKLEQFSVDRCLKPSCFGTVVCNELHHFSDASEQGYGAVSYLRLINENGDIHCSFVLGKSRVTPVKRITIPRLELSAATVAVKLDKMIKKELEIKVHKSVFWTDSTSVLRYIRNEDKIFHTFVANRIATIHDGSEPDQWRYVDTKLNPADDASRGLSVDNLLSNTRWIKGPEFLWETELTWPKCDAVLGEIPEGDDEVKKAMHSYSTHVEMTEGMTKHFSRSSQAGRNCRKL
eukprot:Seg2533.1 transcript_id=Seg2533.1/GoldUCD/mRNA.D3Y31 product="hypothetical protein" protein_id=Seg2533.1/GoldUCD/D3Y31